MGLSPTEKAILMTAGNEKFEHYMKWDFQLEDGESKVIPQYFQTYDSDAENNSGFLPDSEFEALRIQWKSRCAGGYHNLAIWNEDVNGALLGLIPITLTRQNFDYWPSSKFGTKSSVLSENLFNELKSDDKTRQFVKHVKYVALAPKQMHFEEGVLPTGHETNPIETPFLKFLLVVNFTPLTTSQLTFQMIQDFYEYSPSGAQSTLTTHPDIPESDPD